ncbi:hypothetical protein BGZ95_005529 [Linnemannia exigua]|uniref:Transmembrane protein n=1 Tax=Linnemannia exigua TaxID=604196 RepID=A0AAD4H9S0_9FUNG|nr:hypothetical protein BGZ95_005529 [Linnemannia exigua]
MSAIYPVCYTTSGGYIYAAAYDLRDGRYQARLIVAQSKHYPNSPDQLNWQAIGEAPLYSREARSDYYTHTYNCAWNAERSTFALLGINLKRVMDARNRFGIALETVFSQGAKVPPTKEQPLSFDSFETDYYRQNETIVEGKSVVVPVEGVGNDRVQNAPTATGAWVHVQMNETSNELLLKTFFHNHAFSEAPQVAWRMDKYGPGTGVSQNGTRSYHLVAHSNKKLFVVGSNVAKGGLVVTILPLSPETLTAKPISIAQPERYDTVTIESEIGADCNFDHNWTTASVYNDQLFVLCYPKVQDGANTAFQLFAFNGTAFEKTCSLTATLLAAQSSKNHGPRVVPIPASTPSSWAYLSSNFGREGYKIDLLGITTPGGLGGIIAVDNALSTPFSLDIGSNYLSNDIYNSPSGYYDPSGNEHRGVPMVVWLLGVLGLFFILAAAKLVHRQRVRVKEARRREAIANGMDPNMNPETVGGVIRTAYGDDASDALPMYTLRAPPLSYIAQPTDVVSGPTTGTTAAATATQTTTATTTSTATQTTETAGHIIVQGPIPTDSPPSYSPDPARPMIGLEDTQCAYTDDNNVSANGSSEVQPTIATDTTTADAPSPSTESETIQLLAVSTVDHDSAVAAASNIEEPTEHTTPSTQVNIVEKEITLSTTDQQVPTAEPTQAPAPTAPSSTTTPSTTLTVNGDTKTDL